MSLKQTEAIVIKSYNLSEADRIVVFFTREFGLVRGVAKGAKRLQSKFGSTLEPFSTVNLEFFQKEERELVSIQSVELLLSRFAIASDPEFLSGFSYLGDLITDFALPHDADEKLYRMIGACLSAGNSSGDLPAIVLYFELWLLRLSGFLPDWSRCESCRQNVDTTAENFVVPGFHLQCSKCRKSYVLSTVRAAELSAFRSILTIPPSEFTSFAANKLDSVELLSNIMKRLIAQALGREVAGGASLR